MTKGAQYPFQCVRFAGEIFVASAGPKLYTFSASDGRKLFTWPEINTSTTDETQINESAEGSNKPPEKRRKLSPTSAEKHDNDETQINDKNTSWSSIPILVVSPTGSYVVAMTAEDKHIRVFDLSSEGILTQLSARPVPKKPCAISLPSDDTTIICADKSGDVFAIPLLIGDSSDLQLVSRAKKRFQAAANSSVVHTKKNLISLRQQLLLQERGAETKVNPTVKRDLLLGHVSMLTDLAFVSLPSSTSANGSNSYILTAVRDEQIRVSRGPPQTHVIEAYCLGHESFVSKLCIPSTLPHLLVSGGGDDSIFVWDWRKGEALHKIQVAHEEENDQIVVRDIRAMSIAGNLSVAIFVSLEGSRELFSFILEENGNITPSTSLQASGNILDLTCNDEKGTLILAIDCCHEPGSVKNWKSNFDENLMLIEGYGISLSDQKLVFEPAVENFVNNINVEGTEEVLNKKSLTEALYSLHNFRKRLMTDNS